MVTEGTVPNEVGDIFNPTNWETISFKVHTKTYYAPKFKFVHAKISPGKENPVLVALKQMPAVKYAIKVDESITEKDFETLLRLMYPSDHTHVVTPLKDLWSKEEWTSVLKISSLWFYQDLRSLALSYLDGDSLTTYDKITLGRAYSVPEWVSEGLCALGHSHTLLDASDAFETLGHLTALRIYQIRERKEFAEARVNRDNGTFAEEYVSVEDDIERAFRSEMGGLETSFQDYGIPKIARPYIATASLASTKVSSSKGKGKAKVKASESNTLPSEPQTTSLTSKSTSSSSEVPPPPAHTFNAPSQRLVSLNTTSQVGAATSPPVLEVHEILPVTPPASSLSSVSRKKSKVSTAGTPAPSIRRDTEENANVAKDLWASWSKK